MTGSTTTTRWAAAHAERAALAEDLAGLTDEQWATPSLCEGLSVRDVVAHLTAGASSGFARWVRGLARSGFSADRMVARRLAEHLGATPHETLAGFRAIVTSTTAPNGALDAWLGEVVVHGEDVRRPLGIVHAYDPEAVTRVARFYASKNFTVDSRRRAAGLRLLATDGDFDHGSGPLVTGSTLALVMALAGRPAYLGELDGDGVAALTDRG